MNKLPIRILHVVANMNRGGAETFLMNIYRNIDRNILQFDFVVHTKEKCSYYDEIHKLGGKIYTIPKFNGLNFSKYKKEWNFFFHIHPEYKILHSHLRSTASIYLKIAKKYDLISISHSHSTSNGKGLKSLFKKILQKSIPLYSNYLFACSYESGKWLYGEKNIIKSNFQIIYNAINFDEYQKNMIIRENIRAILNLNNKMVIGHIGRFDKAKNQTFLIHLFKLFLIKHPNSILILIGDGILLNKVKNIVHSLSLDNNVLFLGIRNDVNILVQAFDIFVFPSIYEGVPLSLLEVQAASIPCVVSDNISDESIISNSVIKLPLSSDLSIWVENIETLYDNRDNFSFVQEAKRKYDVKNNAKLLQNFYIKQDNYEN